MNICVYYDNDTDSEIDFGSNCETQCNIAMLRVLGGKDCMSFISTLNFSKCLFSFCSKWTHRPK